MSDSAFPKEWANTSIGDVADVIAGGTPKAGNSDYFIAPGSKIAWLTPVDLSGYKQKYISHGARDLSQLGYDRSSAKIMPEGSILFSSRVPIGYVAVAANEISTNQGFKNFVLPDGIETDRLYFVDEKTGKSLLLFPLVRMLLAPASDEPACYFYNRMENGRARLVSYHYETANEQTLEMQEIRDALNELNGI